ncbi:MAG: phosphoribosylaminoimidazolesuccinocarboxamide synthase [Firmicutes bacterium]|jgi:hypothetical protein|nr:phosphoribosylaminoimidazolesuccinocarboxamide synthase [Bacillota bacterium]
MSPIRNQLVEMIDCLPDQEQMLVFEIVKRFISDDVATADGLQATQDARDEYVRGETVNHNSITVPPAS